MAPFYSRYTPTSNLASARITNQESVLPTKKRKLEDQGSESRQDIKKSRKPTRERPRNAHNGVEVTGALADGKKRQSQYGGGNFKAVSRDVEKPNAATKEANDRVGVSTPEEHAIEKEIQHRKPKHTRHENQGSDSSTIQEDWKHNAVDVRGRADLEAGKEEEEKEKTKKKKRKSAADHPETANEDQGDHGVEEDPHTRIRSKFEKTKRRIVQQSSGSVRQTEQKQHERSSPSELHGLEPLPQPPSLPQSDERPTFSSLPPWLANPLQVDSAQSADFSSLNLDSAVLDNIRKQGLEKTLSVQSAVIPLLIDGPHRHSGDVCISAATGSGKTLAYVLPMVQHLKRLATTKLRALIVVPTRELVRQARETCEASAAGTNIKIAMAVGSKSIADEQQALVERYEIYDPDEYSRQQNAPVDWSKVNMGDILSELDNGEQTAANFVVKYRSKIDVLVCTPGRLVDHIRSTKGFALDDVCWLVIDEADRLLNESFQEWIEIVVPALESRASHALQDNVLRHMRLEIPSRIVQKVVLSATLTQDISKFSSLKLRNPMLVVVGDVDVTAEADATRGSAIEQQPDEGAIFNLPSTLAEFAVPVGDGSEKPLYLLELLRTKVDVFNLENREEAGPGNIRDGSESTASESSSSDSDSSTSSGASSSILSVPIGPNSNTLEQCNEARSLGNTALVFTRSTESATRLSRVLSLLSGPIASLTTTLTKSSTSPSTRKALSNFRQHKISIIIATDRASRGLDLPSLGHVISYDVPASMTTYVHRVGRTARAGKSGNAWTLLAHREARWFCNEIGKGVGETERIARRGKVQKFHLSLAARKEDGTRERYEKALKTLGEEVESGGNRTGGKR
jgi:ATP-dependent RNA helicase DDX51/DBP6